MLHSISPSVIQHENVGVIGYQQISNAEFEIRFCQKGLPPGEIFGRVIFIAIRKVTTAKHRFSNRVSNVPWTSLKDLS